MSLELPVLLLPELEEGLMLHMVEVGILGFRVLELLCNTLSIYLTKTAKKQNKKNSKQKTA